MKYDIRNDMTCDRVVHDVNKSQVMIRKGQVKEGVELSDAEADRLIKLRRKLGDGKELHLTKSEDQPEPAAPPVKSGRVAA